ncbi:hypothetical protein OIU76_027956 [Salix suchowensis]|nr:hypothetical protein OIU76_027956 [Salix suchowensis]
MEKQKRNASQKMLVQKQKKNKKKGDGKENRFLISINFPGSAGPVKAVINGDDRVSVVIDIALKMYAREGRLPVLGFDARNFLLYSVNAASDALNPREAIGSYEGRNFMLCKKQLQQETTGVRSEIKAKKTSGWKAWVNKSLK